MIYKNKITKRNFNDLHCDVKKLNQNKTKIKNKETYVFSFVF